MSIKIKAMAIWFVAILYVSAMCDEPSTTYHGKVLYLDRPIENVTVRGKHFIKGRGPERVEVKTDVHGEFEIRLKGTDHFAPLLLESSDQKLLGFAPLLQGSGKRNSVQHRIELPDIVLGPPKVIRVHVVDSQQQPVPDTNVYLQASYEGGCQEKTNEDGVAMLRYPDGLTNQTVGAMKPKFGIDYRNFEVAGQKTHPSNLEQGFEGDVKLCLNGIREVSVKILAPDGMPLPGIEFRPWLMKKPNLGEHWNLPGYQEFKRTSDENGIAKFDMLAIDQEFGVDFWPKLDREDWFVVGNGKDMADERATIRWDAEADVTVQAREMMKIGGRVTHADGQPAKDIRVAAHAGFHYASRFSAESTTDASGNWEMWVKPDGYYLIVVKDEEFASKAYDGICVLEGEEQPVLSFVLEPARRIHGSVAGLDGGNAYVMLQQKAKEYHTLPSQPLPNPGNSRFSISAFSQVSIPVQKDGTFEFKVGPGDFVIWDTDRKTQEFALGPGDVEKKFEFQSTETRIPIKIRVYSAEDDEPVANVSVICKNQDFMKSDLRATTNAAGEIETKRGSGVMHVLAINQEKSLGGYSILQSDDQELEVALWPLATVRGTLVDNKGVQVAGAELQFGVEVKSKGLMSNITTTKIKTDGEGLFELKGIVQGIVHKLYRINKDENGESYGWVADILTTDKETELGNVMMK